MKIPKTSQISNYLSSQRQKKYGPVGKVTIESLKDSAALFSELPEDIDEGYVLGRAFRTSSSGVETFVIVLSTIRLSTFPVGDAVHSDCTYKCTWNSYPVTIMGISNIQRWLLEI